MVLNGFEVISKVKERVYLGSMKTDEFDSIIDAIEASTGRTFSDLEKYQLKDSAKENVANFIVQASQVLSGATAQATESTETAE